MSQGRPIPRNTLTPLEPVMFPMAASALSSCTAARREAKVSGREVPSATKEMAVTLSLRPTTHPNSPAISPTMAVTIPMKTRATLNATQPPPHSGGGMSAKSIFQKIVRKCMSMSMPLGGDTLPSSSLSPCTVMASTNWSRHRALISLQRACRAAIFCFALWILLPITYAAASRRLRSLSTAIRPRPSTTCTCTTSASGTTMTLTSTRPRLGSCRPSSLLRSIHTPFSTPGVLKARRARPMKSSLESSSWSYTSMSISLLMSTAVRSSTAFHLGLMFLRRHLVRTSCAPYLTTQYGSEVAPFSAY
mmetsp:Transcript_23230/g.72595  ORF Transcript_23230/g.72595 Transcript_23230/m.72595 type:complete len:305 (-) Transcript_23230:1314-2228(-)